MSGLACKAFLCGTLKVEPKINFPICHRAKCCTSEMYYISDFKMYFCLHQNLRWLCTCPQLLRERGIIQTVSFYLKDNSVTLKQDHGEDETSIKKHIELMKSECEKANPRLAFLKEHMARTFVHRRRLISTSSTTTQMIMESYPAMSIDTIVFYTHIFRKFTFVRLHCGITYF